jgi:hypothetical protein
MTRLELEVRKAKVLITYDILGTKLGTKARARVKKEVKAEVSRIEAEIAKLKEIV